MECIDFHKPCVSFDVIVLSFLVVSKVDRLHFVDQILSWSSSNDIDESSVISSQSFHGLVQCLGILRSRVLIEIVVLVSCLRLD